MFTWTIHDWITSYTNNFKCVFNFVFICLISVVWDKQYIGICIKIQTCNIYPLPLFSKVKSSIMLRRYSSSVEHWNDSLEIAGSSPLYATFFSFEQCSLVDIRLYRRRFGLLYFVDACVLNKHNNTSYFVKLIWYSGWFCKPYFEAVYCFIFGRRRVAIARYRMICLVLIN